MHYNIDIRINSFDNIENFWVVNFIHLLNFNLIIKTNNCRGKSNKSKSNKSISFFRKY